ncbi:unnamed protein product [Rotaria sordida]|uniref:VWFA domain-containing protein n=1 Tax=Rotaria sordida TaxID=392033 RepID=A0A819LVP9_9BILA|nr:unnamed protein product [Rotaria sordida]
MVDFQELVARYEINHTFGTKLHVLEGYGIVFICDDSGSMNTPLDDLSGPFDKMPSRWDELKQTVSIVVNLASVFDSDGVDVYFLNRKPVFHVRNSKQLVPIFIIPSSGPTPIVPVFRHVLRDKQHEIEEPELLILLATDGVSTDNQGHRDIRSFEYVLKQERKPTNRIPVTIIACTDDDDDCVEYLNEWDKKIPNLDIHQSLDNHYFERKLKSTSSDFDKMRLHHEAFPPFNKDHTVYMVAAIIPRSYVLSSLEADLQEIQQKSK